MTDYIHVSDGGEVSFIPGEMTDNRTTETINEAVGEIVTRDVALRVECPNCGTETDYAINDFDYTELWYGQESVICPTCKNMLRIYHVYRD